jgi:pimeloyl-ACP methyl ester carboxylesterase
VLGGRSTTISSETRSRLSELASREVIELLELPEAGHWLHADDPDGLLDLMQQRLGR